MSGCVLMMTVNHRLWIPATLVPRRYQTLADYAAIGLAPLLIFWMLNSLANFLMLMLYHGNYSGRVTWTLFFYTMGATALARVTIEESRSYSSLYATGLGAATFLVLTRFLGDPIFSLAVIFAVGYLADRIVHDCTIVDDGVDSSGQGLVDSARKWFAKQRPGTGQTSTSIPSPPTTAGSGKTGHQPGRTVLYLALGALPLFGIGQFFLGGNPGTWERARLLLTMYLFASLSLLVVTSFLNLRRYLRQRNTEMPRQVTIAWLFGGMAMILLILMFAFLAPLPGQALLSFEPPDFLASAKPITASPYGWGGEGADQPGDSQTGTGAPRPDASQPQGSPELSQTTQQGAPPGGDSGDNKDGPAGKDSGGKKPAEKSDEAPPTSSGEKQDGQQKQNGEKEDGEKQPGKKQDEQQPGPEKQESQTDGGDEKSSQPESNQPSPPNPPESNEPAQDPSSKQPPSEQPKRDERSQDEQKSDEQKSDEQAQPDPNAADPDEPEQAETPPAQPPTQPPPPPPPSPSTDWAGMLSGLAGFLKFLLIAVLLIVVGVYVYLYREAWLAWLRGWMAARDASDNSAVTITATKTPATPSRPFSSFVNPVGSLDPGQVVVITFQALEAWGREQGVARANDETPNEYMRRLVTQFPQLKQPAWRVVDAYNRIVYGRDSARRDDVTAASSVWQIMRPQL